MTPQERGQSELAAVRRKARSMFWLVGLFSVFVNLLMLTGPIFMLQVYDRVLGSRSEETLLALVIVMAFLFLMMGLLDIARSRIMARVGAAFQAQLDRRVFEAVIRRGAQAPGTGATALRDLEAVRSFFGMPAFLALYDLPFAPLFLAGIAIFHPWLGLLALAGGAVLILVALLNRAGSSGRMARAQAATNEAEALATHLQAEAELVRSLGMMDHGFQRWNRAREAGLAEGIAASDIAGGYGAVSKTFRMFLQSAMLGLAAWLVLRGEVTPGVMIAASILMGRALAPIDLLIAQWHALQRAQRGWRALAALLGEVPEAELRTALPRPEARLSIQQLTVVPPGQQQAALRLVNAELAPGQALGVIGPSGSGKSTLARALTGVWRPAGGAIRLGGATLDQYDPEVLGRHIGYLPQRVQLFEGTIAENIARMAPRPDAAAVVAAATMAGAHGIVVELAQGYDTPVPAGGGRLSGGQIQRIGLARALYGDPVLLVLDEPNANLDNEGGEALNRAIRAMKARGGAVIIMAHRPSAIQECDILMMLDHGVRRAFGPRDEVLREMVANHREIAQAPGQGGIS